MKGSVPMEINRIGCCENCSSVNVSNITKEDFKELIGTKEFRENCKKDKHQEAVQRVQAEFLSQVSEGKSPREAFFNSLGAIEQSKNKDGDVYEKAHVAKEGTLKMSIKPDQIRPWLELIKFAIPIIQSIVELIFPKKNDKPQTENE